MTTRVRTAPCAAAAIAATLLAAALPACSNGTADGGDDPSAPPSQSQPPTSTTSSASEADQGTSITEKDVVGTWVNHHDPEIEQEVRFKADHTWSEDQHGTENIYHGTWEITGDRTFMLQDWEEELQFTIMRCSSIGDLIGLPGRAAYHASKHGVIGLTRSAASFIIGAPIPVDGGYTAR